MNKKIETLEDNIDEIDELKSKFYMNLPDFKQKKP